MDFILTFLEGLASFISPCVLPMLPVYVIYFSGGESPENEKRGKVLLSASGFVLGLTLVFVSLGVFSSYIGSFIREYNTVINIVMGAIIVIFGINYTGLLKIGFLSKSKTVETKIKPKNFFSSFVFGMIFSIGWTPCVGPFLGSALMAAATKGTALEGGILLLFYSLGLGIPFILCAVFLAQLGKWFTFIKKNYKVINIVCGCFLIVIGILMMLGILNDLLFSIF